MLWKREWAYVEKPSFGYMDMPQMLYRCSYGTAPGPGGVGRVALYEVTDLSGEHVESGQGDMVRDDPKDALKDALALGRAAVERLQMQTITP